MTFIVSVIENPKHQNCFGYLLSTPNSTPSSSSFGAFHCVQMSANNPASFVIQAFGDRPPFNFIHINPKFASILGIQHGNHLLLEAVTNLATCVSMEVEPDTFEDWNIIESTACIIEELFLDQIRVIRAGMKFVLFVAPGIPAKFRVLKTEPPTGRESAVMATNLTEVLVAPRANPQTGRQKPSGGGGDSRSSSIKPSVVDKLTAANPMNGFLKEFIHPGNDKTVRVLPRKLANEIDFHEIKLFGSQPIIIVSNDENLAFIKKSIVAFSPKFDPSKKMFGILIEIPEINANENLQRLSNLLKRFPDHCILSTDLESQFPECSWLRTSFLEFKEIQETSTLNISYLIKNENDEIPNKSLRTFLQNYFISDEIFAPILMDSRGIELHYSMNGSHTVPSLNLTVVPTEDASDERCFIFWPDEFPTVASHPVLVPETPPPPNIQEKKQKHLVQNYGSEELNKFIFNFQKEAVDSLGDKLVKLSKVHEKINLLLVGENGSGRSIFLRFLARNLFCSQCIFSAIIDCFEWKGKSLETIQTQLDNTMDILESRQPSILFLDNLNFLNTNIEDEERKKFVDKIFKRIASRIDKLRIHCLATTRSLHQLPEALLSVDGRRLFHEVQEVPLLNQNERENVLKQLLAPASSLEFDHELRAALENLSLSEIVKLSERAKIHVEALQKLPAEAVKAAIEATPTAGRHIQRPFDEKTVTFSEIGGLSQVKKRLTEIFLWPSKYPTLYQKCGLRIGGGAILHGPSGCGKTLLARALSFETKFNVINIKGPELLSKYIGASEQNVRDVFERARSAKPSFIIFDEFDALAPKRGHDSTGVTDRVVNQLLTELDGVESTNGGVYVLAATNRMDLIDGALLRPGRFDHKVLVGLPTPEERKDILEKLCGGVELDADVDFETLAEATENCTGADLKGAVINASFAAADDSPDVDSPKLQMSHFMGALHGKSKRSLQSKREKQIVSSRVTLA